MQICAQVDTAFILPCTFYLHLLLPTCQPVFLLHHTYTSTPLYTVVHHNRPTPPSLSIISTTVTLSYRFLIFKKTRSIFDIQVFQNLNIFQPDACLTLFRFFSDFEYISTRYVFDVIQITLHVYKFDIIQKALYEYEIIQITCNKSLI